MMPEIQLSQGVVRYREQGTGTPIVLIHGLLVNGNVWDRLVPLLARQGRCIVPDLPLGSHSLPMNKEADLSAPGIARLIAEFMDRLELEDVTLVGNDTGGALCQLVAADHRERLGRLVLTTCDAFENFPPPAFKPMVAAAKAPGGLKALMAPMRSRAMRRTPMAYGLLTHDAIPDEVTDAWVAPMLDNAEIRRDCAKTLKGMKPEVTLAAAERFPAFTKPVLIAWGADDRFFPLDTGRRLATLFPNARFEEILGSRTFVSEDQPERLGALIAGFVREPVAV
jgi:pimeloyl-ACP methyl ester carboxylesterase